MPTPEQIAEAMQVLGFNPAETQAIVLTAESAIGISAAYPEPLDPPQEVTDADPV